MTFQRVDLMAAPPGMQPGGYIPHAYADRPVAALKLDWQAGRQGREWRFELRWAAPQPQERIDGEPHRFVDAAALLVPLHADSNWLTMGSEAAAVGGMLWRADRAEPWAIDARGLGTVERRAAPADWRTAAAWKDGVWSLVWSGAWAELDQAGRFAAAVWRGALADRAGLKMVTPGWLALSP